MKKYFIAILIIGALGYAFYLGVKANMPTVADTSVLYADQGREHIQVDATHPEYNSNPPSSGWHYANPADPGFYSETVADEYFVHNMEHGDIWIAYHPDIENDFVEILRTFANARTVIAPRAANETDIALVAWRRVDAFNIENDLLDETRIRDFITRYQNKGPEQVPASTMRVRR
jgi:hypothetical protein